MSNFFEKPPDTSVGFTEIGDAANWHDYFVRQQDFLQNVAKLNETQTFSTKQVIADGAINDGGILLANFYTALLDIKHVSSNARDAKAGGGNAAVYIQHYIDNSAATQNNVNVGIRVQVESSQQAVAGATVNDLVSGYFGIRSNGVNVGGFGIHVDAYSNGSGANTTMYGNSVEMYRTSADGFTTGYHTRSIDGGAGYFDNDFAYLASPSPGGTKRFLSVFAAGSAQTGTMGCDYGLDLRQCDAAQASIAIAPNHYFMWDGTGGQIKQTYSNVGAWYHYVSGTQIFGIENGGRLFIVNNANTVYALSGAASGNFLAINVGGTVYKLNLLNF